LNYSAVFSSSAAAAFASAATFASSSALLKKGEHYWEDLIGLEVVNRSNFVLGKVQNLMDTGAKYFF
jgi:16S rRNA processing protein RimM